MKKDFFDTKIGNICSIIIWALARVMRFVLFTLIGGSIYYICKAYDRVSGNKE